MEILEDAMKTISNGITGWITLGQISGVLEKRTLT